MDEALRELERAAAADPARALDLARGLERAGRPCAAERVLRRGASSTLVRAELARRWPTWAPGGRGNTRYLDVPGISGTPRVRWTARIPSFAGPRTPGLDGSELGAVLFESATGRLVMLDAETGATRWELGPARRNLVPGGVLDGLVVLTEDRLEVLALDGWSGTERWRTPPDDNPGWVSIGLADGEGVRQEFPGGMRPATSTVCCAADRVVRIVGHEDESSGPVPARRHSQGALFMSHGVPPAYTCFDPATLAPIGQGPGRVGAADASGALVYEIRRPARPGPFRLVDARGAQNLWQTDLRPDLLARSFVLVHDHQSRWILDRLTGETIALIGIDLRSLEAAVRGTLYLHDEDSIRAVGLDGCERWRFALADLGPTIRERTDLDQDVLVPLPWALLVQRWDGLIACLEQPDEA